MGGAERVLELGQAALTEGDLRWAAELLNHLVFAEPENAAATSLQADILEQLGFGAENGTWRSAFLAGATELRHGRFGTPVSTVTPDLLAALSPEQVFDTIAIRVDGPRAWDLRLTIGVILTDTAQAYRLELRNGVLVHREAGVDGADVTLRTTRAALSALLAGDTGQMAVEGDGTVLTRLMAVLEAPDPDFAIVTP